MNEETIKQVEFRLKKLKETYKAIAEGTGSVKVKRWMELGEKASTIRALLYEDFENLGNELVWEDGEGSSMITRRKFVKLMTDIFKECRK